MLFNSFQFLWLFPIIFLVYYLFVAKFKGNTKWQNILLIIISYALYIQVKPIYALVLLYVTFITYKGALAIAGKEEDRRKSLIYILSISALLPLLMFKYYNFLNDSVASLLASFGWQTGLPGLNWAVPIGISFFTFQAVGYLFDVYYKRIDVERNWIDYMLFVSFFPQIASGPISKAKDLLPQIKAERSFDYAQAVNGMQWLLWGLFLKVVLADRLGLWIDKLLPSYMYISGPTTLLAAIGYSFQIYSDFAGYSFMALGVGKIMGFDLVNNFQRPYLSCSVTEFWRRWHISLSTWLKDYVYIPLGGSRCAKARTYWNIFVTFLVSGIWHGANWTFIVWGILHGLYQIVEKAFGLQKNTSTNVLVRTFRIFITFMLVTFAWIFFRMPTLEDGFGVLAKIFTNFEPLDVSQLGITGATLSALSLLVLLTKELCEEFVPAFSLFKHKNIVVRWLTYLVLLISIVMCGVLDASQFIYINF